MPGSKFVTGLLEETDRLSLVPIRARPGARCSPIRKSLHPTDRSWENYILGRQWMESTSTRPDIIAQLWCYIACSEKVVGFVYHTTSNEKLEVGIYSLLFIVVLYLSSRKLL